MVYLFLADGFEEVEALTPLDMLRRAQVPVTTVGIGGEYIRGAHDIVVKADISAADIDFNDLTAVILPGGMPGTLNLDKSDDVQRAIAYATENDLTVAAICAAPSILGHGGYLSGRNATCFPGFEDELLGAELSDEPLVWDGNILTAKGAGVAL
ncbi:MAG: DJ-1/PfpI family protein, partial [Clostridia bacterium]|nr:DJ-1/PfpI family protein [Clostridia bacterium]